MRIPILVLIKVMTIGALRAQSGSIEQQIDQCLDPYVVSNNFSGTIYVAKSGKVLYQKSFGKAVHEWKTSNTNETKYQLASVSKPFTSAAILLLEQQGKLNVTDPVAKYLPSFTQGDRITIHHLLSHTSGVMNINDFPEYDSWSMTSITLDSIVAKFQKKPLLFDPGTKYSYSNSNYNVLAYIIEKVSGKKYGEFLKENIFNELKMNNTRHHGSSSEIILNLSSGYSPDGRKDLKRSPYLDWATKTGNGSLYSTVEDLAKFDRILFTDRLLNSTEREKMFTPNLSEVGYGWYLRPHLKRKRSYMTGRSPGFTSYFGRYPDEEVCIIVLSNLYISSSKEIGENVASIVFHEPFVKRTLKDDPLDSEKIKQFIGSYQFGADFFRPNFKFEVTEDNGKLRCSFGDLIQDTGDEFILRSFWSVIHFERDSNQKITGLSLDGTKATRVQ